MHIRHNSPLSVHLVPAELLSTCHCLISPSRLNPFRDALNMNRTHPVIFNYLKV